MNKRIAIGCLALFLAGLVAPARADLSIYIQNATIDLSNSPYATLNIYATGLPTDTFSDYQVTIQISQIGGSGEGIVFAPNASDYTSPVGAGFQPYTYINYSTGTTASNYIFAPSVTIPVIGNLPSDSTNAFASTAGGVSPGLPENSTDFSVLDQSASGTAYAPATDAAPTSGTTGSTTLLGSLLIDGVSVSGGQEYGVTILANGTLANGDTYFLNQNLSPGDPGYQVGASQGYSSGFDGYVMITGQAPTITPEPVSTVTGLTGAFGFAAYGWLRTRRSRRASA